MKSYGAKIKLYREGRGILRFVDEQFKVKLDGWQEQALELFASPRDTDRRISLQACAGPGKSAVLSWAGLWFLACQGDVVEHPKGLATSITGDNLKGNLWAEYAKWMAVSPLLSAAFAWTSSRVFCIDHPATWFVEARSWPKTANADEQGRTFSGLHSKYVLAEVDEAGAIPTTVLRAAEQALSRCAFGKLFIGGNPISLEGMLYAVATSLRHLWRIIKVTGDPLDPAAWVHSPRLDDGPLKWAKEQIATYGRDNPWVMAYILGQFPPASINALLSVEEVEAAMALKMPGHIYDWAEKRLGVDVARFGDDRSVIFPRQGLCAFPPVQLRNLRTTSIAARVAKAEDDWGKHGGEVEGVYVDDTGHWGHGVIDALVTAGRPAFGVVSYDRATQPQYKNRKAEMWVQMADWVKGGGKLPKNLRGIVAELTTPTYTFLGGQFVIEDKDQVKKRLGRSPDLADALALTFATPDRPAGMLNRFRRQGHATTQDDAVGHGRATTLDDRE